MDGCWELREGWPPLPDSGQGLSFLILTKTVGWGDQVIMCPVSVSMCLIRLHRVCSTWELSSNVGRDCRDMISPVPLTTPAKKMPATGAAVSLATLINTSIGWVGHHNFYLQVHRLSSEILRSYFIWVFGGEIKCIFPSACDTVPARDWNGEVWSVTDWRTLIRRSHTGDCPGPSPAYQLSTQLCCSYLDCTIRRASTCDTIIILRLILIVILWTAGTGVLR